jgi:hypothetical protein
MRVMIRHLKMNGDKVNNLEWRQLSREFPLMRLFTP